ncbi:MAG TPA: M14 family metallopeptidase [Chryseosolibacter sp.]|nr:M14 family metallopeptidase [Chryseosolibacter sp.]
MTKCFLLLFIFFSLLRTGKAQPDLSYYLPGEYTYDKAIPTPASVIGHEVGEYHITHDRLVNYMQVLDKASDRITLEITGYTHERRPLLLLTITSSQNHRNLESIRLQHLQLSNPSSSSSLNTALMPAVFYLGCSIHGNEASGSNAGLLIAYHLAAAQGPEIEKVLENTVILFDPSFNPDGLQRFAGWVNSRKSNITSADPNDMEHHEPWPGGRTNHYWFDLNRDWLVAQQPESAARIKKFHQWKPNVLTDHHEMGTHYTFFFQPGVPSRSHPITPRKNLELTKKMGEFHAKAFDEIGSFYYTQEGFDDYYYGKGSTFPDAQGAVGILFEQATSRGHLHESENGMVTFPFTIRNQFTAALSSLKAVNALREELLNYQRQFFRDAASESRRDPVKAFIFGSSRDKARAHHLAEIIARHDIAIYKPAENQTVNGKSFEVESSFIVPMDQPAYKLLKGMFEKRIEFRDSLFYDISSWTLSLATGVEFEEERTLPSLGERVMTVQMPAGKLIGGKSEYAYVFESHGYYAPRAIYRLLKEGVKIKVSTDPFYQANGRKFDRGSILVPITGQDKGPQHIDFIIQEIVKKDGLDVYAFNTGLDYRGVSLGSYSFRPLKKPEIAVLVGAGVTAQDAGEIWHLLDARYEIPATMLPIDVFNTADINRYTTIIFPQGAYGSITEAAVEKLKSWTQNGGVVIGLENALSWFQATGLGSFTLKNGAESTAKEGQPSRPYSLIDESKGAQVTSGAIFHATVDLTHPLLYGYYESTMPLFKGNNLCLETSKNAFGNPIVYTDSPLLSGYISKQNYEKVKGASVAGVSTRGKGRVIGFTENLAFRAFWFGTNKLLMNAIFYGPMIDAGAAR